MVWISSCLSGVLGVEEVEEEDDSGDEEDEEASELFENLVRADSEHIGRSTQQTAYSIRRGW